MTDRARALAERAKAHAYALGFDLTGIARLGPANTANAFRTWIAQGFHGEMDYLARSTELRADTRRPEPGMRSAIVVAMDYGTGRGPGSIARYARSADYHDVMRTRLRDLAAALEHDVGAPVAARPYVDSAPILERDLAQRAGLGWIGKNTMLIHPRRGSFFFIGALFVELDLAPDTPFDADHCGTCTRCLDACPTHAFVEPHVMDARRCLSYLTIEHRSAIPLAMREQLTSHVFGCDICQDVCPWNVRFANASESSGAPEVPATVDPAELVVLDDAGFRARFRGTPVTRAKRRGLARNAAVVLGNRGDPSAVTALTIALHDPEPLVRAHAAWALGRIGGAVATRALDARRSLESDPGVRDELARALCGDAEGLLDGGNDLRPE